ncbi:dihydroxyacetone kinase subunit DhaL [Prosthecomicrobium sp. N25]|uniref:dihydroxyacetone kinase subunit DhaL n=1 Tax=Prosthecomicrobium sp. N25 TaxID=3129254 RepID=UPI003077DA6A
MSDTLETLIKAVTSRIVAAADELTTLDQAIGDGDHGVNMKRGMEAVAAELPKIAAQAPGEALKAAGMQLVMKVGGASGPLYGTLFITLGKELPGPVDRAVAARAFARAIEAVRARGKSDRGQKTMLDVLMPVSDALSAGAPLAELRRIAAEAAAATVPMKAIRGRASFLGDRSIGHMDPGARSSLIMIEAVLDVLEAKA